MTPARLDAAALTTTMTLVLAGNTIATPLLPAYRTRWQLPVSATALLFVIYVVGVAVALVGFGRLADVVGHRSVVLLAVLTCVLATVLALLAPAAGWLLAARVVQGLAAGLVPGATAAALTASTTAPVAARLTSLATTTGIAGGLLLGGALAGLGTPAVWVGYLVLLAPVTGWAVVAVRRGRSGSGGVAPDRAGRRWTPQRPLVPRAGRREFALALAAAAVTFAAMGLFAGLGPLLVGPGHPGGALLGSAVAAAAYLVSGAVQLTTARRPVAVWGGGLVLAVGVAVLAAAAQLAALPLLLVSAVLVGGANGLLFPPTLGTANRLAPAGRRAGTTSTYYLALYGGISVPLLGFGVLADATSLTTAVRVFALTVAAASLALVLGDRAGNRPPT